MKVRLLIRRFEGELPPQEPGDIINLPADQAKRLIEDGAAEPVGQTKAAKRETR